MNIILYVLGLVVSTLIIWKASDAIGDAGDHLAYYFNMPSLVKGAIIAAVASSFPELATVVLSTAKHGIFELGVGTIVGSAVFNILIIPALCQIMAKKPLTAHRDIVYKEGFFYVIAIASVLFMFFYASMFNSDFAGSTIGTITPLMAATPVMMYVVYLFVQQQEIKDGQHEIDDFEPEMSKGKSIAYLIAGMVAVAIGCEILINAVLGIGDTFSLSPIFLGITLCAAATSIPDTLLSVRDAKQGEHDAALANAFGSNTFDLLICIPAGVFIAGSAIIDVSTALLPMGYLTLVTFVALALMRNNLKLEKADSYILLGLYVFFVAWQYITASTGA
jgi:cation:H+ antiporter